MVKGRLSKSAARGSTLFVTVMMLGAISLIAAGTLLRVTPRFQEAHQTAVWEEARLAAESGIDAAMGDLVRNVAGGATGDWEGWNEERDGVIGPVLAGTLNQLNQVLSLVGLGLGTTGGGSGDAGPIFLDNLSISAGSGTPTEVDVRLWALARPGAPNRRWFRIRAMATCGMPAAAYRAPSPRDSKLRRLSLREMRPQLAEEDVGRKTSIPAPSASRVIEVLVEPILPFELGIWMSDSVSLGTAAPWGVDSYDSSDPEKSTDGLYPAAEAGKIQANGNVACNRARPADSPYGALVSANGAEVRGIVATNGGDDPATDLRENVAGPRGIDLARVRDDFIREMNPVRRPSPTTVLPPPILGLPFVAGTGSEPTYYHVAGDLSSMRIAAPATGAGRIVVMVDGNIDLRAPLVVPPKVTAQIYVRGNIDFNDKSINADAGSSRRAAQLQIYGEKENSDRRMLRAHGGSRIFCAFYGPGYQIRLMGVVDWYGSVVGQSFEMMGGGEAGFHYDEALGLVGPPVSFRIARYVEDVRR